MLKVYNTLTRRKEEFKPIHGNRVNIFVCGQTTYDDAHLGHAKSYVDFDVIVRWLKQKGYSVFYVQNITNVDDKVINRAKERGVTAKELAEFYTKRFLEDMEALKLKENVNLYPKSSDYIQEIINQIQTLIEKGYAYVVNGDVYYHVPKFKDYTKLSNQSLEELKKHRIEPDPRKKSPLDFALWKRKAKPNWDSPWSKGRPGWHIEDTAMTITIFGPQYDLHGGANELIFPHHTNEIAQAEAATGKRPFVRYWLHSGVLKIKGKKMSKSLKNFITIRETLKRHSAEAIRLYLISTHYRKPIDFSEQDLNKAEKSLERLYNSLYAIKSLESTKETVGKELIDLIENTKNGFTQAMDDDFNTPKALAILYEFAKEINKYADEHKKIDEGIKNRVIGTLTELGGIFGILEEGRAGENKKVLNGLVELILKIRDELRERGEYELSDRIRSKLDQIGITVEDLEKGIKWFLKRQI